MRERGAVPKPRVDDHGRFDQKLNFGGILLELCKQAHSDAQAKLFIRSFCRTSNDIDTHIYIRTDSSQPAHPLDAAGPVTSTPVEKKTQLRYA